MIGILELSIFGGVLFVQMLGLASVLCARLSEKSLAQKCFQRVFYGCLVLVVCAALATFFCGNGCWASCGTTLAVMAVGVTFDGGRAERILI